MPGPPPLQPSGSLPPPLPRKSNAATFWALLVCFVGFLLIVTDPIMEIIEESALDVISQDEIAPAKTAPTCFRNMKEIARAMRSYARDNDELIPATMSDLYPKYISNPKVLICPESGDVAGPPDTVNEWSSYACVDEAMVHRRDAGMVIREKSGENHSIAGGYCVFRDGRVAFRRFAEDGL